MEDSDFNKNIATFNQASYSQMRLHELFLRIDRLSINPLFYNSVFSCNNYEIIFRDLCSVYSTISPKLAEENETMTDLIEELKTDLQEKPIFKFVQSKRGRKIKFNKENWNEFGKKLFGFRVKLEKLMDKYGFGNPNKDLSPSRFGK